MQRDLRWDQCRSGRNSAPPESEPQDGEARTRNKKPDAELVVTAPVEKDGSFEIELPDDLATFFVVVRAPGLRTVHFADVEPSAEPFDVTLRESAMFEGSVLAEGGGGAIADAEVILIKNVPKPRPPNAVLQLLYPDADAPRSAIGAVPPHRSARR